MRRRFPKLCSTSIMKHGVQLNFPTLKRVYTPCVSPSTCFLVNSIRIRLFCSPFPFVVGEGQSFPSPSDRTPLEPLFTTLRLSSLFLSFPLAVCCDLSVFFRRVRFCFPAVFVVFAGRNSTTLPRCKVFPVHPPMFPVGAADDAPSFSTGALALLCPHRPSVLRVLPALYPHFSDCFVSPTTLWVARAAAFFLEAPFLMLGCIFYVMATHSLLFLLPLAKHLHPFPPSCPPLRFPCGCPACRRVNILAKQAPRICHTPQPFFPPLNCFSGAKVTRAGTVSPFRLSIGTCPCPNFPHNRLVYCLLFLTRGSHVLYRSESKHHLVVERIFPPPHAPFFCSVSFFPIFPFRWFKPYGSAAFAIRFSVFPPQAQQSCDMAFFF